MKWVLFLLSVLSVLGILSLNVKATDLTQCQTISTYGNYVLTNSSITGRSSDCWTIPDGVNNVTIDLNGYTVDGNGGAGVDAFVLGTNTNITIKNGTITDFSAVFHFLSEILTNFMIDNVTTIGISDREIGAYSASTTKNLTISNCNFSYSSLIRGTNISILNSLTGRLDILEAYNVSIDKITVNKNSIYMEKTNNVSMTNSVILSPPLYGIELIETSDYENNTVIENVSIRDCSGTNSDAAGLSFSSWNGRNFTAINLTVTNCSRGIYMNGQSSLDNAQIINSSIYNNRISDFSAEIQNPYNGFVLRNINLSSERTYASTYAYVTNIFPFRHEISFNSGIWYNISMNASDNFAVIMNFSNITTTFLNISVNASTESPRLNFSVNGLSTSSTFIVKNGTNTLGYFTTDSSGNLQPFDFVSTNSVLTYVTATQGSNGVLNITTPDGDQNWSYSNTRGANQTFNLTLNHTGDLNNSVNFTLYGDLANPSRFVVYYSQPLNVPWGETVNETFTVQAVSALTQDSYSGIIEANRTEDGTKVNITVNITVYYAIPNIWESSFTNTQNITSTKVYYFKLQNLGNINATQCTLNFSTVLGISGATWNVTNFNITNTSDKFVQVSIIAGDIAGVDPAAYVTLNCSIYSNGDYASDNVTGTLTLESLGGGGSPGGGGGGGGYYNPQSVCGNNFCEGAGEQSEWNPNSTVYCPADCISSQNLSAIVISPNNIQRFLPTANQSASYAVSNIQILNPNGLAITVRCDISCTQDSSCDWMWITNGTQRLKSITLTVIGGTRSYPGTSSYFGLLMEIPANHSMSNVRADLICYSMGVLPQKLTFAITGLGSEGAFGYLFSKILEILNFKLLDFSKAAPGFEFFKGMPFYGGLFVWHLLLIIAVLIGAGLAINSVRRKK